MNNYEWCLKAWVNKWATKEHLQVWVTANKITSDEFNKIITSAQNS